MQENEFEKSIREKMSELQLVPTEAVWDRVSANIQKEKRKKRFLFLLLFSTLLIATGGFYIYSKSNNTSNSIDQPQTKSPTNPLYEKNNVTKDIASLKPSPNKPPQQLTIVSSPQRVGAVKVEQGGENENPPISGKSFASRDKISHPGKTLNSYSPAVAIKRNNSDKEETQQTPSNLYPQTSTAPNNLQKEIDKSDSSMEVKRDVSDKPVVQSVRDTVKQLPGETKLKNKVNSPSTKKWITGFTVFTGVSNNLPRLTPFSAANASYSTSPSGGTTAPASNLPIAGITYKSGFSYGLGVFVQRFLSKKVGFATGLNYHVESATSTVGRIINTTQTYSDPALQSNVTVSSSYSAGQSVNYKNKYELLEIPLNISIRLNKNEDKQFLLMAGISPAYMVASSALYANTTQNIYYASKDQFKKLQLAAQAGLQFPLATIHRLSIIGGPEVRYGVSNMAKSATGTSQHLINAAVKINVTLK